MKIEVLDRQVYPKVYQSVFPHVTMYEMQCMSEGKEINKIPLIKELEELSKQYGYSVKGELYIHHKVLDIVFESESKYYINNFAISYNLDKNKIVGCSINDIDGDQYFEEFIKLVVGKYIEPIRDKLEWHEVDNGNK